MFAKIENLNPNGVHDGGNCIGVASATEDQIKFGLTVTQGQHEMCRVVNTQAILYEKS